MIEPSSLITYLANRTVGKHSRKIPEGAIIRDTLSFEHLDFRTDFRASLMASATPSASVPCTNASAPEEGALGQRGHRCWHALFHAALPIA